MNRRTFNKLTSLAGAGLAARFGSRSLWSQPASNNKLWNRYHLGAAYYPEWWPQSEWETDFREMQEIGINAARMGEFAWALFEPEPGKFEFAWMDRAIEIANRHGVDAILATPTASVPPWLYQQHPDVLTGNDSGLYTYGGRKGYNTNSPNYLEACARVVTALAEHYGKHPGVIGWQLDNEPGFPFTEYDPVSEKAFQAWLQKRYGTLEELNRVWNGAFWSNMYTEWSQIHFPAHSAEGGWQPAISLDYRRFYSDSFLNDLRCQAEILHQHCENQFVFTNWPSPTWSVDVFAAASEFLDATAWDNYVSAPGLSDFHRQYTAGFLHDFCRNAGPHQRYLCAEQNAYVPPPAAHEGLRVQAYMDLAHGSHGNLYFEWRRPLAGNEEHRPSFIKGFDGNLNPAKGTLAQIGREFARLGPALARATTHADIAILFDFVNQWAQGMGGVGDNHPRYTAEAMEFYNAFKVLCRDIDVASLKADFAQYKLIIASNLRLVDDATADKLRAFVAAGGTLVLNYRAGTQNTDNSMRRTLAPGPFTEMAGVKSEAMLDLFEYNAQSGTYEKSLESQLAIRFANDKQTYTPRTIVENLVLHGAEVLATVEGGRMDGKPAVTRNRYERGWVYYVGVDCNEVEFYETFARLVGDAIELKPLIDAPRGVDVTSRQDEENSYYFLVNLTETAHENIRLPGSMNDLIHEKSGVTAVSLGPLDVAVLASKKDKTNS